MNVIKYIIIYFWDLSRTTKIKHAIISKRKKENLLNREHHKQKVQLNINSSLKTTYHKTTEKTIIAMEKF